MRRVRLLYDSRAIEELIRVRIATEALLALATELIKPAPTQQVVKPQNSRKLRVAAAHLETT